MLQKLELAILILIIAGCIWLNKNMGQMVATDSVENRDKIVVIDAGHGGKDPGKIGINGALEKDINLQIAKKVKILLEQSGVTVVMTRENDVMLGSSSGDGVKREDMEERAKIINDVKPFLAVSIHQNSFSDPGVSGAQMFYYSGSEEGEIFALLMQDEFLEMDGMNSRQAKANDSYYLLKQTNVPTVIAECGFLSNPEEAQKLTTQEYQDEISNAIVRGIESCFAN